MKKKGCVFWILSPLFLLALYGWGMLFIYCIFPNQSFARLPINEITQDYVEKTKGIMTTAGLSEKKNGVIGLSYRGLSIDFGKDLGLDSYKYSAWNNNIIVDRFRQGKDTDLPNKFLIFILLAPALIVLACNFYLSQKSNHPKLWRRVLPLWLTAVLFLAYVPLLYLWFPHWRNHQTSYRETYEVLQKNQPALQAMLTGDLATGIHPAPFLAGLKSNISTTEFEKLGNYPDRAQERNVHNGEVFLSRTPFFPYDYVRINVDLFNYLFYSPKLTAENLEKINPHMTYKPLADGFWLGQYTDYIDWNKRLNFCYYVTVFAWLASLALAARIVRCGLRNANKPENPPPAKKKLQIYYLVGLTLVILGYLFYGTALIVAALILFALWAYYDLFVRKSKTAEGRPQ